MLFFIEFVVSVDNAGDELVAHDVLARQVDDADALYTWRNEMADLLN